MSKTKGFKDSFNRSFTSNFLNSFERNNERRAVVKRAKQKLNIEEKMASKRLERINEITENLVNQGYEVSGFKFDEFGNSVPTGLKSPKEVQKEEQLMAMTLTNAKLKELQVKKMDRLLTQNKSNAKATSASIALLNSRVKKGNLSPNETLEIAANMQLNGELPPGEDALDYVVGTVFALNKNSPSGIDDVEGTVTPNRFRKGLVPDVSPEALQPPPQKTGFAKLVDKFNPFD